MSMSSRQSVLGKLWNLASVVKHYFSASPQQKIQHVRFFTHCFTSRSYRRISVSCGLEKLRLESLNARIHLSKPKLLVMFHSKLSYYNKAMELFSKRREPERNAGSHPPFNNDLGCFDMNILRFIG